jgi:hypothetical protein
MGWASGSGLAAELWHIVREHIPDANRKDVARRIIKAFEGHDCDTMGEADVLMADSKRRAR